MIAWWRWIVCFLRFSFGEFVSFFFFFYFSFSLSFFRYVFCRFIESFARESRSCYALDAFFSFSLFCFFPLLFRFSLPFFYYSDVELRWKFSSFVHRRAGFSEFSSRAISRVPCCCMYALCPGISCLLSVPARACCSTDSSSWKSTYFQKIFRKKLQKDRCFRRINSQYEDSDKKLIKLLTRVVDDIRRQRHFGRSYKKRKETLFFFFFIFFFLLFFFFLLNFLNCSFYTLRFISSRLVCIYMYMISWKLRTFHAFW